MPRNRIALAFAALVAVASTAEADEVRWKKHDVNAKSRFEGAGVLDADNDGKLDIVSGDTWYNAPDWKPYPVRKVAKVGSYFNCFSTMPMDVNGDGNMDYISVSYFGNNVGWVENPGKKGAEWAYHEIDKPGSSEAAVLVDLDRDGRPDILPNSTNVVVWYSLTAKTPEPSFQKHDFGTAAAGHGVGSGDLNGDGRVDLLTPKGWFEGPADPKAPEWAWHPYKCFDEKEKRAKDLNLGGAGIQILPKDVDGDGLIDLVYGMGHAYGLYWARQSKEADGTAIWTKMPIDEKVASVHTLLWADLDGDGRADELVTGKRVYAHEIEPGDIEGSLVASYTFDRASKRWDRHVIFEGEPARNAPKEGLKRDAQVDFPPGTAGTGLEMTAIDIDRDGDIDLVCPGKSGLYLFENLTKSPSK